MEHNKENLQGNPKPEGNISYFETIEEKVLEVPSLPFCPATPAPPAPIITECVTYFARLN